MGKRNTSEDNVIKLITGVSYEKKSFTRSFANTHPQSEFLRISKTGANVPNFGCQILMESNKEISARERHQGPLLKNLFQP